MKGSSMFPKTTEAPINGIIIACSSISFTGQKQNYTSPLARKVFLFDLYRSRYRRRRASFDQMICIGKAAKEKRTEAVRSLMKIKNRT